MNMVSETKPKPKPKAKKTKPIVVEGEDKPKKKKNSAQDNQVLFSRPSSMTAAPTETEESTGSEVETTPVVHEDSAPSGLEHDPTRLYLHELGYKPLLTPADELSVARRIRQGDAAARTKMIESNLRLVVKIARH